VRGKGFWRASISIPLPLPLIPLTETPAHHYSSEVNLPFLPSLSAWGFFTLVKDKDVEEEEDIEAF